MSELFREGLRRIEDIAALLRLAEEGDLFVPSFTLLESPHEPENRLLECAEAAKADYLVTGNKRHFPTQWKASTVVNARDILNVLIE